MCRLRIKRWLYWALPCQHLTTGMRVLKGVGGDEVNIYWRGFLSKSWLMLRFCDIGLYWALAFIAVDCSEKELVTARRAITTPS